MDKATPHLHWKRSAFICETDTEIDDYASLVLPIEHNGDDTDTTRCVSFLDNELLITNKISNEGFLPYFTANHKAHFIKIHYAFISQRRNWSSRRQSEMQGCTIVK